MPTSSKRYAALLNVRKRQEDIRGQVLAAARREHAALRRQRRELDEQRRAILGRASVALGEAFEPSRQLGLYQYERYLGKLTDAKDAEIALHARKVQEARAELESAIARRRMMEKLIERMDRAERLRVVRREQRVLDESSVIRYTYLRRADSLSEAEDHEDSHMDHRGRHGVSGGDAGAVGDQRRTQHGLHKEVGRY